MSDPLHDKGTVLFDLYVPASFWSSVGRRCSFPTFGTKGKGVYAETDLLPDRTLSVQVDGPLGRFWELRSKPLPGNPDHLVVGLTWQGDDVMLYVNGDLHQRRTAGKLP